ncbi:MAG TPA: trypsin-like serine protease [Kofleriaceae bacterium]
MLKQLAPFLVLAACLDAPEESTTDEAIKGHYSMANQWQTDRGAHVPSCSATRIGARYVLTSAHCLTHVGDTVEFYSVSNSLDHALTATVEQVWLRPGVDPQGCHDSHFSFGACYDSNGSFADIALVKVKNVVGANENVDSLLLGAQATLAWTYPGNGSIVTQVGGGMYGEDDTTDDPDHALHQVTDTLQSDNGDGKYVTTHDNTNPGDSGSPLYNGIGQVLATLFGVRTNNCNYTSVPRHLDWLLGTMSYRWPGTTPQANVLANGSQLQAFVGTERVCQYACEHTGTCEAYNYFAGGACALYSHVTSMTASSGVRSALHYGQSSGRSGAVQGYVRGDAIDAVVHVVGTTVRELRLVGTTWTPGNLSDVNAPPPAGKLSAYRRADGTNAVVYRSTVNHVIELALADGTWTSADLTTRWGGVAAAGDPVAYVRGDGVSSIVYRTANNRIDEYRLDSQGWVWADLSTDGTVPVPAHSDPIPFVRPDGTSSIVFRSNGDVYELYKQEGLQWTWGEPSALTHNPTPPPAAASRPYGYTHHDGIPAIVYRSTTGRIIELFFNATGWGWGDITSGGPAPAGDPVANVRSDATEQVLYRSTSNQIIELTNTPWHSWNLTAQWSGPASTSDPSVYIRHDGVNAIVHAVGTVAEELSWHLGDVSWLPGNISAHE